MENKRKVQKFIRKPCGLCGGRVEIVLYSENINGVKYDEEYEECEDCQNRTKIKRNNHKVNNNTKYDW